MRRTVITSLLAAGLVVGAASAADAAAPSKEGNYDYRSPEVKNEDGTCTWTFTANLWDAKKPASGWLYAVSTEGPVVDSRYQLVNPQTATGNTFTVTGAEGALTYIALAPVSGKKVGPAEVANRFCN